MMIELTKENEIKTDKALKKIRREGFDYRNKSVRLNSSVYHSHGLNSSYAYYYASVGDENAVDFADYYNIINLYYNDMVMLILDGYTVSINKLLGNLVIKKRKASLNLIKRVLNRFKTTDDLFDSSHGYTFSFRWSRSRNPFSKYMFVASKSLRIKLHKLILNGYYNNFQTQNNNYGL